MTSGKSLNLSVLVYLLHGSDSPCTCFCEDEGGGVHREHCGSQAGSELEDVSEQLGLEGKLGRERVSGHFSNKVTY